MSTQFTSNNPTAYFGISATMPGQTWYRFRDPNSSDYKGYTIGDRWINKTAGTMWGLTANAAQVSTWVPLGGLTTAVQSLTPDVGAVVTPVGGTIAITGDSAQGVSTLNSGAASLQVTVQSATTALKGVVNLASNAEAIAGTDTAKAVTSDDLAVKLGPQTAHGVLIGEGTSVAVASTVAGAAGQYLISNGAAADPGWFSVPSFSAYKSAPTLNVTGNSTNYPYICDTTEFNSGAYNTTTGQFTAPVDGKYLFSVSVYMTNCTIAVQITLNVVTTANTYNMADQFRVASNQNFATNATMIAHMAAGDTAYPTVTVVGEAGDTDTIFGAANNFATSFQGSYIGQ